MQKGVVISINISDKKGTKKTPIKEIIITQTGLNGDAHSGDWHRQVSLLAEESIDKMRGKYKDIAPGDFAENITTRGIPLTKVEIGQRLRIGETILEISQIGKECHQGCEIRNLVGDCVMPREGLFARVIKPGKVVIGCTVELLQGE